MFTDMGKIGLCGAHRTGKTTLARELASSLKLPFVQTSATAVFERLGLDPKDDLDFSDRLRVQTEILTEFVSVWASAGECFVSDRTPLDLLAYFLGDIQGKTDVPSDAFNHYLNSCLDATRRFFSAVVVVQPGIPLVYEPGKAALNIGYIEHLNAIVSGLVNHEALRGMKRAILPRECLAMSLRIGFVTSALYSAEEFVC